MSTQNEAPYVPNYDDPLYDPNAYPPFPTSQNGNVQCYYDLEQAMNAIGCSLISMDHACRCLAYVAVVSDENCVLHPVLSAHIAIAAYRAKLHAGFYPDPEYIRLLRRYREDLESGDAYWLPAFLNRYKIKYGDIKHFLDKKPLY